MTHQRKDKGKGKAKETASEPRQVALSIVYSPSTGRILMVTSRAHPHLWILPKGGVEEGETGGEAAVREAWEEAGSPPTLPPPSEAERLSLLALPSKKRPATWHVYILEVEEAVVHAIEDWPESHERKRAWYTPSETLSRIKQWYTDPSALEVDEKRPVEVEDGLGADGHEDVEREGEGEGPTPTTAGYDPQLGAIGQNVSAGAADGELAEEREQDSRIKDKGKSQKDTRKKKENKGRAMEMAISFFADLKRLELDKR
ncbi:hypothetical protein I317_06738 [Kwoniella heveanensis CBS 569]|nr:hypothetical protein I317_06738 [Kwoniella heveanensis CBS 569]